MSASFVWQPVAFPVVLRALWDTFRHAGLVDYFDIASVTLLIYLALRWIHRARAIRVMQGMLIVGLFYTVAQQTGLVLTTSVFRGLFTVAMLSIVSLFQEDLRHFFERLTVYRHDPIHKRTFQAILRSVRHFSERHIGALIVLKGQDPLDRHMDGGQLLNGRVSGALLESLFDPHSDGHDGAVIVDGDYVARFGVHLPLSKRIDPDSGLGTRHAAALGLAEFTDAFCLVVSETKGSVMVAREGVLMNMGDGNRLESRLADFLREKYQSPAPVRTWKMLFKNPGDKGLSLLFGLVLWLIFVKGIRPAEQTFSLPVQATKLPAGIQLDAIIPANATVTLRGLERDLHILPAGTIVALKPVAHGSITQKVALTPDLVHVSPNLQVAAISPNAVVLRTKKKSEPHRISKTSKSKPKPGKHAWFKIH